MTIGEAARKMGLEASAIRYYERVGILPLAERQSGRRVYGEEVLDLLALVKFARGLGFSIAEVKTLFGHRAGNREISASWATLATRKLVQLDGEVIRIRAAKRLLSEALACRCVRPEECGRRVRRLA